MNKRGFLPIIVWIVIIVILIGGGYLAFKFSSSGFKLSTGNIIVSVDYSKPNTTLEQTNNQNKTNLTESLPKDNQKIRIVEEVENLTNTNKTNPSSYENLSN